MDFAVDGHLRPTRSGMQASMDVLLTIGEFSKMTYLSVKALRHYHEVGLLEPAAVDPSSGYRLYAAGQISTAQAIRRFRELDMPLEQVRAVLEAPDVASRNEAILTHLRRMQEQLTNTQTTIASLQSLLEDAGGHGEVELRSFGSVPALAITEPVGFDDCSTWLDAAYEELHTALDIAGVPSVGSDGALYPDEFFELGEGRVVAFVPVPSTGAASEVRGLNAGMTGGRPAARSFAKGRTSPLELAAGDFAVMVHSGPFGDLDQTYGALGTVVAERGIGAPGPIREHYLDDETAEVCWPVTADPTTADPTSKTRPIK